MEVGAQRIDSKPDSSSRAVLTEGVSGVEVRRRRAVRLRRSDCSSPGIVRLRRGRGFVYLDVDRRRVTDSETLARVELLRIPPAWRDVWVCSDPRGHLQATGIDAAGRKQYLYHSVWREQRAHQKFRDMERFARELPGLRRRVRTSLEKAANSSSLVSGLALWPFGSWISACFVSVARNTRTNLGLWVGDTDPGSALAARQSAVFDYLGKSGVRRRHATSDPTSIVALRRVAFAPCES